MAREIQRSVLPIPDQPGFGLVTYDARDPDTKFPPVEPLRPPEGAPNVLVILLDDVGFGASSAFGGPCDTPTAEKLADGGLKYTRFHPTALCAPTRKALLTGRNHHSAAMGSITETATAAPGQTSLTPNTKAPLPLTLKLNGYSTGQFGKCHEVPVWQSSPMGPFDMWPSGGGGFEYFYGLIGGENNQWYPALYEGLALMPDKPFFMYFAPGATHAPHHVPRQWAEKYRGKFAHGWDAQREITLARQKELGVVAADADLTARHAEIPAWDDMPEEIRPVLERQMEVYAGFLEHTDYHIGRLIDTLEQLQVLDNTLVFYIVGDNGASAEGTLQGAFNEMANFNGGAQLETPEFMVSKLEEIGTPTSYNHYAVGWAWAMDAPYQWSKQVASHWGGTRNGTIVHWPRGITGHGGTRSQFCHVIDVAPTILEAAGIPEPAFVNGVQQSPMEGTSMVYSLNDAEAPERHDLQYFEMVGNRGIYYKGWSAVTKHRTPWVLGQVKLTAFDDDVWELYDGTADWTQAHDLASKMSGKLHELQRLWLIEAVKYDVLPLDDRAAEQIVLGHCPDHRPRQSRRRHHRPGRPLRRVGALRQGRHRQVRLQPARHGRVHHRGHPPHPRRPAPDPDGVRVRRRRPRQGRQRHALLRRREGRRGTSPGHPADDLLRRRNHRHRRRLRHASHLRLRRYQQVQRQDRPGADRSRRRQPRPPDRPGGRHTHRHGQAVAR